MGMNLHTGGFCRLSSESEENLGQKWLWSMTSTSYLNLICCQTSKSLDEDISILLHCFISRVIELWTGWELMASRKEARQTKQASLGAEISGHMFSSGIVRISRSCPRSCLPQVFYYSCQQGFLMKERQRSFCTEGRCELLWSNSTLPFHFSPFSKPSDDLRHFLQEVATGSR